MRENCVLTIGKFEGLHLGHQALIQKTVCHASLMRVPSIIMIFSPHPNIYFGDTSYKPLFTADEHAHILDGMGISNVFAYPFDEKLTNLSPKDFCNIIFTDFKAKMVIVGENFRFGKSRAGDIAFLKNEAANHNADIQAIPDIFANEEKISTSQIRNFLENTKLKEACLQLGFPFFIFGTVTKGKQLGRTIGFPTLNMYPPKVKFLPPNGVYATTTTMNGIKYRSITNIGLRPTVDTATTIRSVETHLLNYNGDDLYGKHCKTELLEFIRPECRFNSLDELKIQIAKDIKLMRSDNNLSAQPLHH